MVIAGENENDAKQSAEFIWISMASSETKLLSVINICGTKEERKKAAAAFNQLGIQISAHAVIANVRRIEWPNESD